MDEHSGHNALQWPSGFRSIQEALQAILAANPAAERARVVFTAFNGNNLDGPGKMQALAFLPVFCNALATHGIASHFVTTPHALRAAAGPRTIVVHIYREVGSDLPAAEIEAAQQGCLVFNTPHIGSLIADKLATSRLLTQNDLPAVKLATGDEPYIFSNAIDASGAQTWLVKGGTALESGRYNTEFIDTRTRFQGTSYFTTVRLLCIGSHIVHGFVRAGEVKQGRPSIHAADTPLDPALIEHLQTTLVDENSEALAALAQGLGDLLGPGFYAHDLLVERGSGDIFICETGFKFHDWHYGNRIRPIIHALPSHRFTLTPDYAVRAAKVFLQVCRESGLAV